MEFPADFSAKLNLVFIAFQQWQQAQVDSWIPLAEELIQQYPIVNYYEFPTIQRMNRLARIFINEGMRAGIRNESTRARTVTLYLDKGPFKRALGIDSEESIWVMLFDRSGSRLWHVAGQFTPGKGQALRDAIVGAANKSPSAEVSGVDKE